VLGLRHVHGERRAGCGGADQLAAVVRIRLKRIQYRPALIDGFLAQTGLSLEPEPP
jgi:putative transposase